MFCIAHVKCTLGLILLNDDPLGTRCRPFAGKIEFAIANRSSGKRSAGEEQQLPRRVMALTASGWWTCFFICMKISPGCTSTGSAANLCIGCLSLTDLALARHLNTTVLSTRVCQRSPTLRAKCVMGRTSRGRSRSCCRSGSFTTGRC